MPLHAIAYNDGMSPQSILYIVATPIGDPGDITLRALETLRAADIIICEERRQGSAMLKKLGISPRELLEINEHNEAEQVSELVNRMLITPLSVALISDCGTPIFSDPGSLLIDQAAGMGITVSPIPGASSFMAALSILDFKATQFVFGGFLSRVPDQRRRDLTRLRGLRMPVVLMDTPYRLAALLDDVIKVFGKGAHVTLACDLTLPKEKIYRGSAAEVLQQVSQKKAEFVLIIH